MKPCLCLVCPHCKHDGAIESVFHWVSPIARRFWFAGQHCQTCGSRWSAWHWLEQRTGLTIRRTFALNPGRLTAEETARLVVLKRRVDGVPVEQR